MAKDNWSYREAKKRLEDGVGTDDDRRRVKHFEQREKELPVEKQTDLSTEQDPVTEEVDDPADTKKEVVPSAGNSSSPSDVKTPSTSEKPAQNPQSPAPTTVNPSSQGRTVNSTAGSTGGSGKAADKK
jgi:hypothetical protein